MHCYGMAASAAISWRYPIAGLATWNRELSLQSAQLLAAARGYHATGLDSDPAMIAQAARLARRERSPASFTVATLDHAARNAGQADVVSAASLLAVVPDPVVALRQLWSCVAAGGTLLVIETSHQMTPANARRILATGLDGPGRSFLTMWAHARNGRAIPRTLFDSLRPATARHHPLLAGLVVATTIENQPNPSSFNSSVDTVAALT